MSHIIQLRSVISEPVTVTPRFGAPSSTSGAFGRPELGIRTKSVYVIFTSVEETLAAARVADDLARAMAASLTVVHFRPVLYALAVERPDCLSPVEMESLVERLRAEGLEIRVRVYLCRTPHGAIPLVFTGRSLVVVAGRRTWWRSRSERWRRALESAGQFVVFVDVPRDKEKSDA